MFVFTWTRELEFVLLIKKLSILEISNLLSTEQEEWKRDFLKARLDQKIFEKNKKSVKE
jgi:hypothetical protein